VVVRRLLLVTALALGLAGCGGSSGADTAGPAPAAAPEPAPPPVEAPVEDETGAQLWVTRDRGADVLLAVEVPAGLTVLQALDRETDLETRYGGRFVQAVNGIEGSLERQQDWFYFLNGVEPDVGAAEVRLEPGDVAWWDFRGWGDVMAQPVVVGALPEPFRRGYGDEPRPVEVRAPPELAAEAGELSAMLGGAAASGGEPNLFVLEVRAGETGAVLTASRGVASDAPVRFTLAGSEAAVRAAALALARDPAIVRFRYEARFDQQGRVVG
jgi:hypothetical protein